MAKRTYYSRTSALIRSSGGGGRRRRHPSIHIRWKVVIPVVFGLALLGVLLFVPSFWWMDAEKFTVHGVPQYMHGQILIDSDLDRYHSFALNAEAGETLLKAKYPDAKEIEVECSFVPAACDVYFTPRVPVVAWVTTSRSMLVDDTPHVFHETSESSELPTVTGPLPGGTWAESELRDALLGVEALQALGVPVENLEYDPQRGLMWVDEAGRKIAFGIGQDMQTRWDTYEKMLDYFESRNIAPSAIDVRFPSGVTYLLEGSW